MADPRMLRNLDVRVRDRNLKSGVLSKKDVKSYLEGLPDVSRNAEAMELRQPGFAYEDDEMDGCDSTDELDGGVDQSEDCDGPDGLGETDEAESDDDM